MYRSSVETPRKHQVLDHWYPSSEGCVQCHFTSKHRYRRIRSLLGRLQKVWHRAMPSPGYDAYMLILDAIERQVLQINDRDS